MSYKVDLHVHSKYSGDTDAEPEELVLRAVSRGLHGIAFTEHYSYEASEPVERLREKYEDAIMILRGVELSTAEGHCLIFGANTDRLSISHDPVETIVQAVNNAGGVVIPSHPFRRGSGVGEALFRMQGLCAIEGCNGANLHAFNTKAIEAARELNLPFTGGSDAHALHMHMGPFHRVIFPYEYLFRCVNTHLLLDEALTGDVEYDKYLIYSALEQGHSWVGYDLLGSTKGFTFTARSASEHASIGERSLVVFPNCGNRRCGHLLLGR